jgi:hypothetical protein
MYVILRKSDMPYVKMPKFKLYLHYVTGGAAVAQR